jgi:hypothetical protein
MAAHSNQAPYSPEPAEIQWIRASLCDGLAAGESSALQSYRRQVLSSESALSLKQVGAIYSRIKMRADELLSEHALSAKLTIPELVFAMNYLYTDSHQDAQAQRLKELSQNHGIEERVLNSILPAFRSWLLPEPQASQNATPSNAETSSTDATASTPAVSNALPSQPHLPEEATIGGQLKTPGAWVDYSFDSKVAWRQAWRSFVEKHFSAQELRNAKVICMPSPTMEEELKIYFGLGVAPENILAVEGGDQAARQKFVENALRFGIRFELGRLHEVLPSLTDSFNIVNFDFTGPYCEANRLAMANLRIADRTITIVNLLGRRESRAAQQQMHESEYYASGQYLLDSAVVTKAATAELFGHGMPHDINALELSEALSRMDGNFPELPVTEVRAHVHDKLLCTIGTHRYEDMQPLVFELEKIDIPDFQKRTRNAKLAALDYVATTIELQLYTHLRVRDFGNYTPRPMTTFPIMHYWLTRAPVTYERQEYSYESQASNSKSPFFSLFQLHERPPADLLSTFEPVGRFIFDCSLNALLAMKCTVPHTIDARIAVLRAGVDEIVPLNSKVQFKHRLCLFNGKDLMGQVQIGKLFAAFEAFDVLLHDARERFEGSVQSFTA